MVLRGPRSSNVFMSLLLQKKGGGPFLESEG